jgi:hypothetical protein
MATNKKETKAPRKLSDAEVEQMRERLAEHEAAQAQERRTLAVGKYKDINEFLDGKELDGVADKVTELVSGIASSAEDRNLYFSLDNIRIAIESARAAFEQQLRSVGITTDDLAD